MILICSDINEPTTDVVCSWLRYLNKAFIRISEANILSIKSVHLSNNECEVYFTIDDQNFKLSDFTSYWYRRSFLNFAKPQAIKLIAERTDLSDQYSNFLNEEYHKLNELFIILLTRISKLNTYKDNKINKLNTLLLAKKVGINIPKTIINDSFEKEELNSAKWITKPISDLILFSNDKVFTSYTQRVDNCDFQDQIEMSLIQHEIKKLFEIRSFYFNHTFYSSAIFSQGNVKTELDFRQYDTENPNRVVPFKLPIKLEMQLMRLCKELDLNSGSFDIAYTTEHEYVLFEVNPVGQFEQVSFPCNFNIHEKIAQFL